jgi:hypothetical protein
MQAAQERHDKGMFVGLRNLNFLKFPLIEINGNRSAFVALSDLENRSAFALSDSELFKNLKIGGIHSAFALSRLENCSAFVALSNSELFKNLKINGIHSAFALSDFVGLEGNSVFVLNSHVKKIRNFSLIPKVLIGDFSFVLTEALTKLKHLSIFELNFHRDLVCEAMKVSKYIESTNSSLLFLNNFPITGIFKVRPNFCGGAGNRSNRPHRASGNNRGRPRKTRGTGGRPRGSGARSVPTQFVDEEEMEVDPLLDVLPENFEMGLSNEIIEEQLAEKNVEDRLLSLENLVTMQMVLGSKYQTCFNPENRVEAILPLTSLPDVNSREWISLNPLTFVPLSYIANESRSIALLSPAYWHPETRVELGSENG